MLIHVSPRRRCRFPGQPCCTAPSRHRRPTRPAQCHLRDEGASERRSPSPLTGLLSSILGGRRGAHL
eukprot:3197267-Alexandrium_andersonii.AAC.1